MDAVWTSERRLWLDGAEAYAELMATQCVMAFGPMGVMRNKVIVDNLHEAPRWADVAFADQVFTQPAERVQILAYKAEARRDGAKPYRALCTSTYVQEDGSWRIAQHQQTPLD